MNEKVKAESVPLVGDVVPIARGIVRPAVTPDEAIEAWNEYQALKKRIVTPEDVQVIQGKDFLKKSYWRKIATFFNLQVGCVKEEHFKDEDGILHYLVIHRASHPNGRYSDGDGACSSDEKGLPKTFHNTRAIAMTRSWNRAVSNLVGGGEVSAEEIVVNEAVSPPPKPSPVPTPPLVAQAPTEEKSVSKTDKETQVKLAAWCEVHFPDDIDKQKRLIKAVGSFRNKDGEVVEGPDSIKGLKGKWLKATWGKASKIDDTSDAERLVAYAVWDDWKASLEGGDDVPL